MSSGHPSIGLALPFSGDTPVEPPEEGMVPDAIGFLSYSTSASQQPRATEF